METSGQENESYCEWPVPFDKTGDAELLLATQLIASFQKKFLRMDVMLRREITENKRLVAEVIECRRTIALLGKKVASDIKVNRESAIARGWTHGK